MADNKDKTVQYSTGQSPVDIGKDDFTPYLPAEKKFDRHVYGGISYAAQALTGIGLTFFLRFTNTGKKAYKPLAEWIGPNFIEKIGKKRGEDAVKAAGSWITVSTMVMVGNAFLLPVKRLEREKPGTIRKWTEQANTEREANGEVISQEERDLQEKRLKEIEEAPKQNWPSLLGGRAFGLGAVYAVLYAIGGPRNEWAENKVADFASGTAKFVGLTKLSEKQELKDFSKLAFNDGFYSMISAGGLYIYSHFIHPPKNKTEVVERAEDPTIAPPMEKVDERMEERLFSKQVRKGVLKPHPPEASHAAKISSEPAAEQTISL